MSRIFILTLPEGVTREGVQCVEDQFDEKLLEEPKDDGEPVYDPLPRSFTTLDEWPVRTNLHCCACLMPITGRPIPVPLTLRSKEYVIDNVACGFPCAAYHIRKSWAQRELLLHIFFEFTRRRVSTIEPGPSRMRLRCHGGTLTMSQFLMKLHEMDPAGLVPSPDAVVPERLRGHV